MKKYIQLQDSYDSKKGDIWEKMEYSNEIIRNARTSNLISLHIAENNPDWFALYEEKKEYSKTWDDIKMLTGFFVGTNSKIYTHHNYDGCTHNRNLYATENQAKAALAEAQLSQLLKEIYEGEEWKPNWEDEKAIKYCITSNKNNLLVEWRVTTIDFIALPTQELAEQFLKNHRDLIETYFKKFEW